MKKTNQPTKRKKLKLKLNVVFNALLILVIAGLLMSYVLTLKIKNIKILGTTETKDIDIIEKINISNYPYIYKLNIKKSEKTLEEIPLIKDVKIKRNIFGKLTIEIEEEKILFFYKYNNKYITNSGNSITDEKEYYGYPTLINFTPDTVFESFVNGLNKIDYNIIKMINEIEYTPYKSADGTIIDNNHFTLKMNDTNTVMIDTVNIKNLNKYQTIIASPDMDSKHGIIYLDTINDDRIYIKSYETIAAEQTTANEENQQQPTS